MIDLKPTIVSHLSNILPTYNEWFVDSSIKLPAITYQEYNSYDSVNGQTLGYSVNQYMIKLWGYKEKEMMGNLLLIDKAMRSLGFKRISKQELVADN